MQRWHTRLKNDVYNFGVVLLELVKGEGRDILYLLGFTHVNDRENVLKVQLGLTQ